jgi:hypothetical protein
MHSMSEISIAECFAHYLQVMATAQRKTDAWPLVFRGLRVLCVAKIVNRFLLLACAVMSALAQCQSSKVPRFEGYTAKDIYTGKQSSARTSAR